MLAGRGSGVERLQGRRPGRTGWEPGEEEGLCVCCSREAASRTFRDLAQHGVGEGDERKDGLGGVQVSMIAGVPHNLETPGQPVDRGGSLRLGGGIAAHKRRNFRTANAAAPGTSCSVHATTFRQRLQDLPDALELGVPAGRVGSGTRRPTAKGPFRPRL